MEFSHHAEANKGLPLRVRASSASWLRCVRPLLQATAASLVKNLRRKCLGRLRRLLPGLEEACNLPWDASFRILLCHVALWFPRSVGERDEPQQRRMGLSDCDASVRGHPCYCAMDTAYNLLTCISCRCGIWYHMLSLPTSADKGRVQVEFTGEDLNHCEGLPPLPPATSRVGHVCCNKPADTRR